MTPTPTGPTAPPPTDDALVDGGSRSRARLLRQRTAMRDGWALFRGSTIGVAGLTIIGIFAAGAVLHPILLATVWDPAVYDPVTGHSAPEVELVVVDEISDPAAQIDLQRARLRHDPTVEVGDTVVASLQPAPPSWQHPLGTDPRGRDILSQLMFGARTAFGMGAIAALAATALATAIAATAAYYRGWVDSTLMRIADVFLLLPAIPLLIFASSLYEIDVVTLGLVFGVVSGLGPTAIVLKAQALSVAVRPFVDAARVAGGSDRHIIVTHLVPNILPLSFLYAMFTVTGAIGAEAILSLFGLINVPMSWGIMINVADTGGYMTQGFAYWWLLVPAGLAVTVLAGAFYLVGRGLDEVVDPRLRRR